MQRTVLLRLAKITCDREYSETRPEVLTASIQHVCQEVQRRCSESPDVLSEEKLTYIFDI